jgi:hypothetical protein
VIPRGGLGFPALARCARRVGLPCLLAFAIVPAAGAATSSTITGTPTTGARGVTETVLDMLVRDRVAPLPETAEPSALSEPFAPQTAGASFKAIGLSESTFVPPSPSGDVGTTQVLVHANGRVRVFSKAGAPGSLNVTALTFWSSVANGSQPVFPQVRYDRLSGRWILVAVNSTKPNNRVMIAVQTTPGTITAASSFTFYWFDQSSGGGGNDNSRTCDSPRLGIDNNALYIGCNMVTNSGTLSRVTVYVVRKSSVIPAPGTLVVTAFRDISNGTAGPGPFTPAGVDNDDAQATVGYFIGVDIATDSELQLRTVTDPGGTPSLSGNVTLSVPSTAAPISQPASGSSVNLDAGDDRLARASLHRNKLTGAVTLSTSQSIEVDAGCVGIAGGGRNGARWHEITGVAPTAQDPLGGGLTLVQSGTLCDPAPSTPKGYIYPSSVASGQGHMAIAATVASSNLFAGAAAAGRLRLDPAGATQAATTIQNGLASYNFVTGGKNLWGDYSFTDVDPSDDQTIWTFQEYADTPANNWAIRAVQLRAPPPPTLSGLQAVLCQGFTSTTVTLTGTADAPVLGSEFFDPGPDAGGPGYASHLTATVSGGVTVNFQPVLVLPPNPAAEPVLKVSLSLNTTSATAGLKNVTIRNPDQQSTIGTGVIRVDQPGPATVTNNGPICAGATLQLFAPTIPGATFAWTGPNGFTSSLQNPTIPNAGVEASGTYIVSITGTACPDSQAPTTATVIPDFDPCSDGSACTTGDTCTGGSCQGAPIVCNDGNGCTNDSCNPATGCVFTNNTVPCDDANACTSGDVCGGGTCHSGAAITCNDSNGCTNDSCNPATGCVFTNNTAPCSDGNACTTGDTCGEGSCQPGGATVCNDNNVCTDDSCNPATGCVFTNNSEPCSDGNACTSGDTCGGGSCHAGAAIVCNDDSVCTADSCNPATGCVFTDTTATTCSDGNVCTADLCDPVTGCFHADADGAACDDGDACTEGDTCAAGVCLTGTPVVCDDANVCTVDSCDTFLGCVFDDRTVIDCADGNPCTDDACDAIDGCSNPPNTNDCNDGNACTVGDICDGAGTCLGGGPRNCDDANPCTDDSCDPGIGCVHVNNTASCDDGNACTTPDTCGGGVCLPGSPVVCGDGNGCTDDSCNPATGCVFTNNTLPCDDGSACTAGDACGGGTCQPGAAVSCDDGNPCTLDSCNPATGCVHTDNSAACNDGNACTADSCDPQTGCVFTDTSASCSDGNPCTNDGCNPATGCVFTNNTASCDDENACTTGDTCGGGTCHSGAALTCNDSNGCTTDTCNPATGCVFTNNTAPCSDGNACTTGDTCGGGSCQPGGATVCNDNNACTTNSCNPATGCVFTDNSASCNDSNVCTTDSCNPATGCVHTNVTGACNDGSACTNTDTCVAGVCQGTTITCNDNSLCTTDSCNPATGCVFTPVNCDDNNPCTADSCMPTQGCKHQNATNGTTCSDGNACTNGDVCQSGSCRPGTALVCNDNSVCTADSCSPATGCVFTDTTATQCNDSNPCTNDLCNAVTGCFHSNNTASCSDGNACTTGDTCGGGTCHAGGPTVCNDANPCTNDSCNSSTGCVFTNNTASCSDGNACTTGDTCAGGSCQPGTATVCNDGNGCTDDSCNPATGCVFSNNTTACSDGNACTTGDTCAAGSCQPGGAVACNDDNPCTSDSCSPATGCVFTAIVCNDSNPCTDDSCSPATGCVFAANTNACQDGSVCTTGDTCGGGSCHPGTPIVCNDSNGCTTDSCNPATGCVFTNNTFSCDDGNACTNDDACSGGACAGIPATASEVHGLVLAGHATTTLSWAVQPLGAVYDVVTSTLSDLLATGPAGATCLVNDEPGTSFIDPQSSPAPGAGYYYLVRAQSVCGTGSYGNSTGNIPRVPAAGCP